MENSTLVTKYVTMLRDIAGRSTGTIGTYTVNINTFGKWLHDERQCTLADASGDDIIQYKNARSMSHACATVSLDITIIRLFYAWCVEAKYMTENPVPKRMHVKVTMQSPKQVPTCSQFLAMRAALEAKGNKDHLAVFELLAGAGLRISALLTVRPKDMTFGAKSYITVDAEEWREINPASCKGRRASRIPMTAHCAVVMQGYVLGKPFDKPIFSVGETTVGRIIDTVRPPELNQMTAHSLRHFYASMVYRQHPHSGNRFDVMAASHALCHSDIKITSHYLEMAETICDDDQQWQTWAHGAPLLAERKEMVA